MVVREIKKFLIFKQIKDNADKNADDQKNLVLDYLIEYWTLDEIEFHKTFLKKLLTNSFFSTFKKKMNKIPKLKRTLDNFEKMYKNTWLNTFFKYSYTLDTESEKEGNMYIQFDKRVRAKTKFFIEFLGDQNTHQ